jgi:hypothetical protein
MSYHSNLLSLSSGVMSEAETSSSRLRRGAKQRNSYGGTAAAAATGMPVPPSLLPGGGGGGGSVGVAARPRTSPSQPGRSPGPGGGPALRQIYSQLLKVYAYLTVNNDAMYVSTVFCQCCGYRRFLSGSIKSIKSKRQINIDIFTIFRTLIRRTNVYKRCF